MSKTLLAQFYDRLTYQNIPRYCMRIFNKSPAAYRMLQTSGVFVLPSRQRLCKEKNAFTPSVGFRKHILDELKELSMNVKAEHERTALIVIDEMKIKRKEINSQVYHIDLLKENSSA